MSKVFKIINNDISDGYHTFDELYEHRCLLFVNLALTCSRKAVYKFDPEYGDWLCLYLETDNGQISYHIPSKFLYLIEGKIRRDDSYKWDGHTSEDVISRLVLNAKESK